MGTFIFVVIFIVIVLTVINLLGWLAVPIAFIIFLMSICSGSSSRSGSSVFDGGSYNDDYYEDYDTYTIAPHNGRCYDWNEDYPRCEDGSPDMRYSENYTHVDDDD